MLNAASSAAAGPLLAKMDDDDVYGREHLWDLALAREYSGAALVGKFPATVYLAGADRTVRCRAVASETWSCSITGGTTLLARADLERAGGWRAVRRHVDEALIEDVVRIGGGVYRTHDAGYVLVRHGDRHTWQRDDADFLATAEAVHAGWQPALAGIEAAAPPAAVRQRHGTRCALPGPRPALQAPVARPTTRPTWARSALLSSLWWLHVHEQALGAQTVPVAVASRAGDCRIKGNISQKGMRIVRIR